jgi:ankyrin repeat protein
LFHFQYPEGAVVPNKKGKIALHYAAREGHAGMVNFFLAAAPATAAIATRKGKLAVHFAAGEGHTNIVQALVSHYPKSAALSTTKGKLPVHFSARWGYQPVTELLLQVYPDGIRALDWEGALPLHDAAREGQVEMVRYLVEHFPEALRVANIRSEIPLFPAAQSRNIQLVLCMLQAWPAGGKYVLQNVGEDDDFSTWSGDLVELLLRGATNSLAGHPLLQGLPSPKCVLNYDVRPTQFIGELNSTDESRLLLDRLSDRLIVRQDDMVAPPSSSSTTTTIVRRSGSSVAERHVRSRSPVLAFTVKEENDDRKTSSRKRKISSISSVTAPAAQHEFLALHAAFRCSVSSFVLNRVLAEHASEFSRLDAFGRHPLHWAVTNKTSFVQALLVSAAAADQDDVGRLLLTETTASTRDCYGKLPLHIAIEQKAPVSIVKALLAAWPKAAISPSHAPGAYQGCSPLKMAIMRRCGVSTIFELLRADPTFVKQG